MMLSAKVTSGRTLMKCSEFGLIPNPKSVTWGTSVDKCVANCCASINLIIVNCRWVVEYDFDNIYQVIWLCNTNN
jgi:hypothetical protein